MKITAQIAGSRNDASIVIPVSLADGKLEFDVPNVARANACSFAVDLAELQEAVTYLGAHLVASEQQRALSKAARDRSIPDESDNRHAGV